MRGQMKMRGLSFVSGLVLSAAIVGSILVAPATAKKPPKPPPPPPPPPPPSTSSTYVRDYAEVIDSFTCDMTPQDVQATADGGSIALASDCRLATWLVKSDAAGNPQWQEEVGCFNPAGYAIGIAVQQTSDGGYVIGGGTTDCDFNPICPYLGSQQCGLIQKLDASGNLVWSRVYSASASNTGLWGVKQTSDGGFVAVGTFTGDSSDNIGSLILKVDGGGTVQWQRTIGPAGRTNAYLNAVQQTADGGYVAAGELAPPSACQYGFGCGQGVLVVKLDANGNLAWQRGFNSFDSSGAPTASEHALSLTQSADGGYVVAGNWQQHRARIVLSRCAAAQARRGPVAEGL